MQQLQHGLLQHRQEQQQQQQQQQQAVEQGEPSAPALAVDSQPGGFTGPPPEEPPLGAPLTNQQLSPESVMSQYHPLQYSSPGMDSQLKWSASGAAAELGIAYQQGTMSPGSNSAAASYLLDSPAARPSMTHPLAGHPAGELRLDLSSPQPPGPPLHQDPSSLDLLSSEPRRRNTNFFGLKKAGPHHAALRGAGSGAGSGSLHQQQHLHQDPSTLDLLSSRPRWRNINFRGICGNFPNPRHAPSALRATWSGSQLQQQQQQQGKEPKEFSQLARASLVAAFEFRAVDEKLAHALLALMPQLQYFRQATLIFFC